MHAIGKYIGETYYALSSVLLLSLIHMIYVNILLVLVVCERNAGPC